MGITTTTNPRAGRTEGEFRNGDSIALHTAPMFLYGLPEGGVSVDLAAIKRDLADAASEILSKHFGVTVEPAPHGSG